MTTVWSYGGGTQSIAIAALIIQGKIPKPDFAVIADTSFERGTTWKYLDLVTNPMLKKVGLKIERLEPWDWVSPWGKQGPEKVFASNETVLIPAFSSETSGPSAKLPNYCTKAWKIESVNRWLRMKHGVKVSETQKWLGLSFDEPRRWVKHYGKPEIWLPLVELRIKRQEAIRIVEKMGWPTPPRSACFMCPNQSDDEWFDLKSNHPTEFARAVEIERQVRSVDPHAWFHSSCVPLDEVDFRKEIGQGKFFCSSGECFT